MFLGAVRIIAAYLLVMALDRDIELVEAPDVDRDPFYSQKR